MRTTIEMAREAAGAASDWALFREFMPEIHKLAELVRADERARMAEQPAQHEPVAIALNTGTKQGVKWLKNVEHGESLYTTTTPQPAQRKPLTEEEMEKIAAEYWLYPRKFVRAIEAAHGIKENT